MLKASISILCKKRTTGASSTSAVVAAVSVAISVALSSNSKSPPMMSSIASVAVVVLASTSLESLSNSAMTQSKPIWVENLMRSAAAWSDGSAVAMIRRLPRLLSTSTRKSVQILGSSSPLGRRWGSTASRSTRGAAKAADSVCARSAEDTAPEPTSSAMKLVLPPMALRYRSSAAFCGSLPAATRARPIPGRATVVVSRLTESATAIAN